MVSFAEEEPVSLFLKEVGDLSDEKIKKLFKEKEILLSDVRKVGKHGLVFILGS